MLLVPLHLGYVEQPQKEPYLLDLRHINLPHTGHIGNDADADFCCPTFDDDVSGLGSESD